MSQPCRSAAITGIGCVTNFGCGSRLAWDGELGGVPVTRPWALKGSKGFTTVTTQAPAAGELEAEFGKLEYPRPSRATLMALIAAREAWRGANFSSAPDPCRVGLMINRSFGEIEIQERYRTILRERRTRRRLAVLEFVRSLANTVLGRVAIELKARGPSLLSVGPAVFGLALDALRLGEADVIVAGGVDHLSDLVCELCDAASFSAPSHGCAETPSPYGRNFSGLMPGDGAAFLVLERVEYARARGVRPIALLDGSATVMDHFAGAYGLRRSLADVRASIQLALDDAETDAGEIGLVSGAATGLRFYDEVELEAIQTSFDDRALVFSTKGVHGETWGAAGALALAAAGKAVETGLVPLNSTGGCYGPNTRVSANLPCSARVSTRVGIGLSFDLPGSNSAFVVSSC